MKLVLTAAFCLVPVLAFAGEKPTNEEPTVAATTAAAAEEVVEEVASEDCACGDKCCLRTRRVWPFRVVEVFDCKDGCCTTKPRVVTPRCRCACSCDCECEEAPACEPACEDSCTTRCRSRLFGWRRCRTSCSTCCN